MGLANERVVEVSPIHKNSFSVWSLVSGFLLFYCFTCFDSTNADLRNATAFLIDRVIVNINTCLDLLYGISKE